MEGSALDSSLQGWKPRLERRIQAAEIQSFFLLIPHGCAWELQHAASVDSHLFCVCAQSPQPCPTLCNPMGCSPPGSSVHGIFPSKITGVSCHALSQGIFPSQGLNPCLPRLWLCRQILCHWATWEAPPFVMRCLYKGTLNLRPS